jgi:hypothetical protein
VSRRDLVFFACVGAAPIAVGTGAAFLLLVAMNGGRPLWRPTEEGLISAIRNDSPVAVKVYVESLPSMDTPVPFSHPRILSGRQLDLAPLAIALVHGRQYIVEILRETGSDPAKALGQLPPETAAALLDYAVETQNAMAIEYLTKYRADPARATNATPPARER